MTATLRNDLKNLFDSHLHYIYMVVSTKNQAVVTSFE